MKKIILASKSPRRKEILENLNIEFDVVVSDADEDSVDKNLSPELYVGNLASIKAFSVCKNMVLEKLVIGADTIVVLDGKILGKPKDEAHAYQMLKNLSGKTHFVVTAITVINLPRYLRTQQ